MIEILFLFFLQVSAPELQESRVCLRADVEEAFAIAEQRAVIEKCDFSCYGCGCKGGPGYRNPRNAQCVGWSQLNKVCGPPPHSNCIADCAKPVLKTCAIK